MTTELTDEQAAHTDGPSDATLIAAVRAGDSEAYGLLYSRHVDAARRLARSLAANSTDVDDLVAEVFAKLLVKLRGGGGPDAAFRTYLLTSLRNSFYDRARCAKRVEVTDDVARHDPGVPFVDTAIEGLERSLAARAFARLPERLQLVLWHTEVEGESPATVAPLLSLTPNGVSALAYRARERLRQAYLQEHLSGEASADCSWAIERLGAHVRGALSNRDTGKVQAHLSDCDRCRALYADLGEVNSGLRGILAPLVLGGAATGYLASAKATLSVATLWGAVRRTFSTWTGQVAVAGGGVVAATAIAFVVAPHVTPVNSPEGTLVAPRPGATAGPSSSPAALGVPAGGGGPTGARSPAGSYPAAVPPGSTAPGSTPAGASTSPDGEPAAAPDPTGTSGGNSPGTPADVAGRTGVTMTLEPSEPLTRGKNGTLVLTLTNDGDAEAKKSGKGPATGRITAEFRLPAGVTLRAGSPGDQWRCVESATGAVCQRPSLPAGQSTTARVPVTVASDAADGTPQVTVTSVNIGSQSVQASSGVTDSAHSVATTGRDENDETPRSVRGRR